MIWSAGRNTPNRARADGSRSCALPHHMPCTQAMLPGVDEDIGGVGVTQDAPDATVLRLIETSTLPAFVEPGADRRSAPLPAVMGVRIEAAVSPALRFDW